MAELKQRNGNASKESARVKTKAETPAKEVRAAKTDDRLPAYPFWIVLMAAGIAVSAGAFFSKKKSGLKNQK